MRPVDDAVRLGRDFDPLVYDIFIVELVIPLFSYYFARISAGRSGDTGSHPSPRGRSGDGEGVSRRRDGHAPGGRRERGDARSTGTPVVYRQITEVPL